MTFKLARECRIDTGSRPLIGRYHTTCQAISNHVHPSAKTIITIVTLFTWIIIGIAVMLLRICFNHSCLDQFIILSEMYTYEALYSITNKIRIRIQGVLGTIYDTYSLLTNIPIWMSSSLFSFLNRSVAFRISTKAEESVTLLALSSVLFFIWSNSSEMHSKSRDRSAVISVCSLWASSSSCSCFLAFRWERKKEQRMWV